MSEANKNGEQNTNMPWSSETKAPPIRQSSDIMQIGNYDIFTDYPQNYLGGGTFCFVHLGKDRTTGKRIACKMMFLEEDEQYKTKEAAMNEINILTQLNGHPCIVDILYHEFVHYFDIKEGYDKKEAWMVLELLEGGSLIDYHKKNVMTFQEKLDVCVQTAGAVSFLHGLQPCIFHGDVMGDNIGITKQDGKLLVKLMDFGCSRICENEDEQFNNYIGHSHYLGPEFWADDVRYDKSVDIFALGMTFGYLLKALPLQDMDDEDFLKYPFFCEVLIEAKAEGKPEPVFIDIEDSDCRAEKQLKGTIHCMTKGNPKERMKAKEVYDSLVPLLEDD